MSTINYAAALQQAGGLIPDYMREQLTRKDAETTIRAREVATDAAQISNDAEQRFRTGLTMLERDPTPGNIAAFARANPQHARTVLGAFEMQDKAKREADFSRMGQAYAATNGGRVDLASRLLREYRDAPGGEGDQDDVLDSMIEALDSGDPALINQAKARMGYTVALLAGVDKFSETMNAHDGYTVNAGDVRYDAFNNPVAAVATRPEVRTINDGGSQTVIRIPGMAPVPLPMGSGLLPQPSPAASAPPAPVAPAEAVPAPAPTRPPLAASGVPLTATRGVRNNNPGNLEDGAFARRQPGYVGTDGRFAVFEDAASGIRAQERLLTDHYFGRGINTVRGVVAKYAPASDGNDTARYAEFIAKRAGVSPTEPITDPAVQRKVAQAMRVFESRYEQAEVPAIAAQVASTPRTGGASSAGTGGGVEVLAVGAPRPKYALLSPTEVAATPGLDPTRAYQRSPDGRVTAIAGPTRRATGGSTSRRRPASPRPTVAGVIAPLVEKMARGETLTPSEQTAMNWYKSRSTRSTRGGGGQAPQPTRYQRIATDAQGRKMGWDGKQWVAIR